VEPGHETPPPTVFYQVEKQNIRVERKSLVCEVMDIEEDPTFPLVTKKPKQPPVPPPGAVAAEIPSNSSSKSASHSPAAVAVEAGASPSGGPAPGGGTSPASSSGQIRPAGPTSTTALQHSVEYINRPVDEVLLTVQWPRQPASVGSSGSGSSGSGEGGVVVEVSGRVVHVSVPGHAELRIPLPFALEPQGSRVEYDPPQSRLEIRLRIQSVRGFIDTMRQEKPLAFGQIGLGSEGLLELE